MSERTVDIHHIARLARLELTPAEEEQFRREIEAILAHVQQLESIDVTGVLPTAHATHLVNVLRTDEPGVSQPLDRTMANAPATVNDELFRVHAVLGDNGGSA